MSRKYPLETTHEVHRKHYYIPAGTIVKVVRHETDNILVITNVKGGEEIYISESDMNIITTPFQANQGQFVVITDLEGMNDDEFKVGDVFEVTKLDEGDFNDPYFAKCLRNDEVQWLSDKNFKPLPMEWQPFQVGQKIQYLKDRVESADVRTGEIETITDRSKTNIKVKSERLLGIFWEFRKAGLKEENFRFYFDDLEISEGPTSDGASTTNTEEETDMNTQATSPKAVVPNDGAFANRDIQIARSGTKIVLPNDPREMSYDEAIETMKRMKEQDNIKVDIFEEVDAFPLEGAWALNQVLKAMFGYVMQTESIFGATSVMVTLEVGPNQKEQVVWGEFKVPGVSGKLQTGAQKKDGQLMFVISGTVLKKEQGQVKSIADAVRAFVAANSLYKGKAVRINTVEKDPGVYEVDIKQPPRFIDLSRVNENELTFSDDVRSLVQTNLFTPIERTEECRKYKIPLKRNVLLEGPFGTGKTLTAFVTAKKAQENKWTFIYLDRPQALRDILIFARRYAPAVIFVEDIDRVVSGKRDQKVDDILNNIDGLDSKGHEIMCIFTTNEIDKIEPAMLRAGRLDAVIPVMPPDAKAAAKLIRIYSQNLIAETEDLSPAGEELRGTIPAFIREVVERAKLFAIGRMEKGAPLTLTAEDIRICAVGMKAHIALVNPPKKEPLTKGDKLALALSDVLGNEEYDTAEGAVAHRTAVDREARLQ